MPKFKTLMTLGVVLVALIGIIWFFKWDIEVSSTKKHKVAIEGYDAVSYFLDGQAMMGNDQYEVSWNELEWRFTSEKHRALFEKEPAKYAPQFGGNCSFTTSLGKEQMGLGKHWLIKEGKLYLNSNLMAHYLWKFFPSLIPEAEAQWVALIKKKEEAEAAAAKKLKNANLEE